MTGKLKILFKGASDNSGIHSREKAIWTAAGYDHETDIRKSGNWYIEAGRGMGERLLLSNEKQESSRSDEGTFPAYNGDFNIMHLIDEGGILQNI